ncbi:hypothetical protein HAX54_041787 [Datura stramonium]|uniref:Uncharacterized protein n=1 Tax=Datura stramonium TaxID=4076 RepID=A0ABS8SLJ5_DATST|nr:hypothetical protein [Datura stramonium]
MRLYEKKSFRVIVRGLTFGHEPSNPPIELSNPTGQPSNPTVESSNPPDQLSNLPIEPQTDDDPSGEEYEVGYERDSSEDILEHDCDVNEEYSDFRENMTYFNRSNRRARGSTAEQVRNGEKGP